MTSQALEQVLIIYRVDIAPLYTKEYLAEPLVNAGWSMAETQDFAEAGMRVEVWRP